MVLQVLQVLHGVPSITWCLVLHSYMVSQMLQESQVLHGVTSVTGCTSVEHSVTSVT